MRNLIIGFVLGLMTIGAAAQAVVHNNDGFYTVGGLGRDGKAYRLVVNPDGSVNCAATVARTVKP
jgi:hypothetical protein